MGPQPPPSLEANRRTTRIIAFALWVAPLIYLFVFTKAVLHGDPRAFLAPLGAAPWSRPELPVLVALGAMMPVPAFLLRHAQLEKASTLQGLARWERERTAMILAMALLESVAIFGLVLGFIAGPAAAPVTALLSVVPLVLSPLALPPHARSGGGDGADRTDGDGSLRPR